MNIQKFKEKILPLLASFFGKDFTEEVYQQWYKLNLFNPDSYLEFEKNVSFGQVSELIYYLGVCKKNSADKDIDDVLNYQTVKKISLLAMFFNGGFTLKHGLSELSLKDVSMSKEHVEFIYKGENQDIKFSVGEPAGDMVSLPGNLLVSIFVNFY